MKEKNKNILTQLLQKLPAYLPPDRVWEQVERAISSPSPKGLDLLPQYQPPGDLWESIESRLDAALPAKTRVVAIKRFLPWAAAVAAAITGVVWFAKGPGSPGSPSESVTITYSRESVDPALLQRDWEQDEAAFEMIDRLCAGSAFTCTNPDMRSMQVELDELTEAKQAIENALGKYGGDVDLIVQLAEIERQRTALLKQILEYFI